MRRTYGTQAAVLSIGLLVASVAPGFAGQLTGTVVDDGTGMPVEGVSVRVLDTRLRAETDDRGRYAIDGVPAGVYTVQAARLGYHTTVHQNVRLESASTTLDFRLPVRLTEMDQVVVTATRAPRRLSELPANTSVIGAEELQQSAAQSLDDALRLTPGIDIDRPVGVLFTSPAVSMRGMGGRASEGRTLVMVDGVAMNDPYTGGVAWNSLTPGSIERIEVVRGAASSIYGSHAMGGVINVISRTWTEQAQLDARLSYGSRNTPSVEAGYSGWHGRLGYAINGSWLSSAGYITVPQDSRQAFDQERTMDSYSLGARLRWAASPGLNATLNAAHYAEEANAGRPLYKGESSTQRLSLTLDGLTEPVEWQGSVYGVFRDSEWTYDTWPARDQVSYVSDQPMHKIGASSRATLQGIPWGALTVAADMSRGEVDNKDVYHQIERRVETSGAQTVMGMSAEQEVNATNRLSVLVSARYDYTRNTDGVALDTDGSLDPQRFPEKTYHSLNPRLGLVYRPDEYTTVRASSGRAFQAPGLYSLYRTWVWGTTTYAGNPDLEPERLTSYEIGVDRTFGHLMLGRVTLYRNDARDFIYSMLTDPDNSIHTRENVGEVKMQGVETEITLFPAPALSLTAMYTFNESVIEAFAPNPDLEGKLLTYAPRHKLNLIASYRDPRRGSAQLAARMVGKRYANDANTQVLDDYWLVDLTLSRTVVQGVEASFAVTNLLDNDYEEKRGILAPPRLARVGLTFNR